MVDPATWTVASTGLLRELIEYEVLDEGEMNTHCALCGGLLRWYARHEPDGPGDRPYYVSGPHLGTHPVNVLIHDHDCLWVRAHRLLGVEVGSLIQQTTVHEVAPQIVDTDLAPPGLPS